MYVSPSGSTINAGRNDMTNSNFKPPAVTRSATLLAKFFGALASCALTMTTAHAQACDKHGDWELRCAMSGNKVNVESPKSFQVELKASEPITANITAWFSYCGLGGHVVREERIELAAGVATKWASSGLPKEYDRNITRLTTEICYETYVTQCKRRNGTDVNCQAVVSGKRQEGRPM